MPRRLARRLRPRRLLPVYPADRPSVRGDCEPGEMARPCPFVGCRYHLYEVDREGRRGRPAEARAEPEEELAAMPETCALDVAARQREKMSLDGEPLAHAAIGQILGLSRETVKKIEASALASLRAGARSFLAASPIADEMGDEEAAPDLLSLATSTGYMPLGFE